MRYSRVAGSDGSPYSTFRSTRRDSSVDSPARPLQWTASGRYSTPGMPRPSKLFQRIVSASGNDSGLAPPASLTVHRSNAPAPPARSEYTSLKVRAPAKTTASSPLCGCQASLEMTPGGSTAVPTSICERRDGGERQQHCAQQVTHRDRLERRRHGHYSANFGSVSLVKPTGTRAASDVSLDLQPSAFAPE